MSLASPVPWRRPHSKYAKNEVLFDMIESLEGIVSADGRPVVLELTGRIECTAHLTGMPELSVALNNPTLVQFPAWHPCVRHRPWTEQRQLNFVPPDGSFVLGHYTLAHRGGGSFLSQRSGASYANQLPLTLRVHLGNYEASREGFPFKIAIDPVLRAGLMLEHVTIEWYLGDGARGVDASTSFQGSATYSRSRGFGSAPPDVGTAQPTTAGSVVFDRQRHVLRWTLPQMDAAAMGVLRGTLLAAPTCRPLYALQVQFLVTGHSLTGLKISSIHLQQEHCVPTKGARTLLQGALEWRR